MEINLDRWIALAAIAVAGFCLGILVLLPSTAAAPLPEEIGDCYPLAVRLPFHGALDNGSVSLEFRVSADGSSQALLSSNTLPGYIDTSVFQEWRWSGGPCVARYHYMTMGDQGSWLRKMVPVQEISR